MIVVIEHQADAGLDLLADWLAGHELRIVRPYLGEAVPAEPDAGLIVLGGAVDAYADTAAPWLPDVRKLLATAVEQEVPTLGVCLGAQLLAVACGGAVDVGAPAGTEAGVVEVQWNSAAADDPLCAGLPAPFPSLSMHSDAVARLPADAVLLGSTAQYPNQAFRVGAAAWGVQFHPEVSLSTFTGWTQHFAVEVPTSVVTAAAQCMPSVVAAGELLAGRFAALVST